MQGRQPHVSIKIDCETSRAVCGSVVFTLVSLMLKWLRDLRELRAQAGLELLHPLLQLPASSAPAVQSDIQILAFCPAQLRLTAQKHACSRLGPQRPVSVQLPCASASAEPSSSDWSEFTYVSSALIEFLPR